MPFHSGLIASKVSEVRFGGKSVVVKTMGNGQIQMSVDEAPSEIGKEYAEIELDGQATRDLIMALVQALSVSAEIRGRNAPDE
jgi:hypothetical protein